jgi:hypothetical protein
MGIDPAKPGTEMAAIWEIKAVSGFRSEQSETVVYPAPFDFRLLDIRRITDFPDGCLSVCGEMEL